MKVGDKGFFYHSNAKKATGIVGTVNIVREAYPDTSATDTSSKYFDAKHSTEKPVWFMVDVQADKRFESVVLLQSLKESQAEELSDMVLLKKGSRLSVQPVSKNEWDFINKLAKWRLYTIIGWSSTLIALLFHILILMFIGRM